MSKEAKISLARYLLLSTRKESGKITAAEILEMNQILQDLSISHGEAVRAGTQSALGQFG